MDIVIEQLLHQEQKLNDRSRSSVDAEKAMSVEKSRQGPKKMIGPCHYCGRMGHFRRDCWDLSKLKEKKSKKHSTRNMTEAVSSDGDALLTSHVLVGMSTGWIVDWWATSHMCTSRKLFVEYRMLQKAEMVTIGDGRRLEAVGCGMIHLWMKLPDEKIISCQLQEVLHVPDLTYNLVSVSKASEAGKLTKFDNLGCHILNCKSKLIDMARKFGSLYFLNCQMNKHARVVTRKEDVWHRRYGHLGVQSLK